MTVEAELNALLERRKEVQSTFQQANKIIEQCKQDYAELSGAIKLAEKLISEAEQEESESCAVGTTD
tara:strand:- start:33 stop:233 length:201 start_codon:yes stop_codon:yes gene_type:complete